jgi:putative transposase
MSRPPRAAEGGLIYHALNRAVARSTIFDVDSDYDTFLRILAESASRHAMRVLAYCVMPNHFHLIVWPQGDGDLSRFMRVLTMTHTQRWHAHRQSAGTGHLYQGRFKSFPVQGDGHLLALGRYVERNALRAGLAPRAEDWRWGSLWKRSAPAGSPGPDLDDWPIKRPADWVERVNTPLGAEEEEAIRRSIRRGQPFGAPDWRERTADRLGLRSTLQPLGRPRKDPSRDIGS